MSDGGGESARVYQQPNTQRNTGGEDFTQAISKIAVAQICESEGFQTFQQSALQRLSDIAVRFIQNIGRTAHFYANFAGRTECNAFDIIHGLEDFGSTQGFSGASDIEHCLASSGTVRELTYYVAIAKQIPFAYSIPQFPVVKDWKLTPSFSQTGKEPPSDHIPAWLPAFPDPHSYIMSPKQIESMTELKKIKIEEERKHRKAERSLLNLQQWFAYNGVEGSFSVNPVDPANAKHVQESNPFVATPLRFGEKEVTPVVIPAKLSNKAPSENPIVENYKADTHISVLETFAPAIESMKGKLSNSDEKMSLSRRSAVQFKIGMGTKSLITRTHLNNANKGFLEKVSWFARENDDKKRRAEEILKDSMENSQDQARL